MSHNQARNTEKELYREDRKDPSDPDNYYSSSVSIDEANGQIVIKSGGTAVSMSIEDWVRLALGLHELPDKNPECGCPRIAGVVYHVVGCSRGFFDSRRHF